ncbi:MAG: type II toxin-antitoxin system RelE/ParE family toxin [Fimbriimonas ginsengisoli]|uniref:Type II toxin-antitoxin system RelE/ParE family toxin n=1 Tax=Fimbriimonas ginsengisoli TaxID=1005039 RepID=A0A931LS99_FIMGI|nr:type II toxin-antitoxin system RelE/ParE family toxin [Fimbriimonas ginsengisoli]
MEFRFDDPKLELLYSTGGGPLRTKLSEAIVRQFFKVVGNIDAATDERELRALKSRRFEKLSGDLAGRYSMRLNDQFRLVFKFDDKVLVIEEIKDYHR